MGVPAQRWPPYAKNADSVTPMTHKRFQRTQKKISVRKKQRTQKSAYAEKISAYVKKNQRTQEKISAYA